MRRRYTGWGEESSKTGWYCEHRGIASTAKVMKKTEG